MSLDDYLHQRGVFEIEGYSRQVPAQMHDLIHFTGKPNMRVMEIGFNAGHSAEIFLQNNPTLSLVSFDLGIHDYVAIGKEYIDSAYPGRHTLILGDSCQTVPEFYREHPGTKFDVIFIDGGHEYHIAKADIDNCFKLAHKDTLVLMDDIIALPDWHTGWTVEPTVAWKESKRTGILEEIGHSDYTRGRGMSWGKYNGTIHT